MAGCNQFQKITVKRALTNSAARALPADPSGPLSLMEGVIKNWQELFNLVL